MLLYNYSSGISLNYLSGHSCYVLAIEVLSDQYLASGSGDKQLIVWDLTSSNVIFNLTGHSSSVLCVKRLSSSLMASAGLDNDIIIWNWISGKLMHILKGHTDSLSKNSLDLFNWNTLISGSWDKTIRFWDISNGSLVHTLNSGIKVNCLIMIKTRV